MRWWTLEYLASEKFVLASESNLSLATGLASWKVSLESWIQKTFHCNTIPDTNKIYDFLFHYNVSQQGRLWAAILLQKGVLKKFLSLGQGGISNYQVWDLQHILLVVCIACVSYRSWGSLFFCSLVCSEILLPRNVIICSPKLFPDGTLLHH